MSEGAAAAAPLPGGSSPESRSRASAAKWRIAVYATATLSCVAWSFFAGKDLNWDALSYHLYAGWSALHDRFGKDFLAAGPQAYLLPYAHLPLYAMVKAGWPSLAAGTLLAALHSVNLWLAYELALRVVPRREGHPVQGVAVIAVVLAFLNPVLLQTLGSTYIDATTGAFALGGWVVLAGLFHRPAWRAAACAGVLLGIATALKLSNAVFAVAGVAVVLCLHVSLAARLRMAMLYGGGCALAFAVVYGPWALRLWREFHNPFFPLFNTLFQSPDFMTEPLKQTRFVPQTWGAALWRPIEMAFPLPMVHVEPKSPDLRYLGGFVIVVLGAAAALRRRFGGAVAATPDPAALPGNDTQSHRALLGITAGFVVAWALWLALSGNSRYFIPMGCVAGVLVAAFGARLLAAHRNAFAAFAVALIVAQSALILSHAANRWAQTVWRGPWFDMALPERFQREPYLFVTFDMHAPSFLLPFLAEGTAMLSISGQVAIAPATPGGARAVALLAKHAGRVRTLDWVARIRSDGSPVPAAADFYDGRLRPFGLKVDFADCDYILVNGGPGPQVVPIQGGASLRGLPVPRLMTCAVVASNEDLTAYRDARLGVDRILDRVEDACPLLFSPRHVPTQQLDGFWRRLYMNTEIQAFVLGGNVYYRAIQADSEAIKLGTVEDWTRGTPPVDCGKKVFRFRDEGKVPPA